VEDNELRDALMKKKAHAFNTAVSMAKHPMPGLSKENCNQAIVDHLLKEAEDIRKFLEANIKPDKD
jgi:hypothetical protein